MTYGFDIKPVDDPYVKAAQDGNEFLKGMVPGSFLVDAFPTLKHIPDWIPGIHFKKNARIWGKGMIDSCEVPFNEISKSFMSQKCVLIFKLLKSFSRKGRPLSRLQDRGCRESVLIVRKKTRRNY